MIPRFLVLLDEKFKRIFFKFKMTPKMHFCGKKAFIARPYRIDGAKFISLGDGSFIQSRSWLFCMPLDGISGQLNIGSRCVFGYNNHIASVRDVCIGDDVLTANNVYISDNIHEYENINVPIINQKIRFKRSVKIGSGSWIGENVSIIGASIGRNCVIGANSVVTSDVPDYSVAVGSPAKVIRQYDFVECKWIRK